MLVLKLPGTRLNDGGRLTSNVRFGALTLPVLFLVCQVNRTLLPTAGPPLLAEPVVWMSALTCVPPPAFTFVVKLAARGRRKKADVFKAERLIC